MSTVLIVDDEKNVLMTLSMSLRRYAYTVYEAQSGEEALQVLESLPCDFVVSDIRMAPMDGYTLASRIRAKFPHIGIIFMSAYGMDDPYEKPEEFSLCPRLTKPFPISELIRLLKEQESVQKKHLPRILLFDVNQEAEDVQIRLETLGFTVDRFFCELSDLDHFDFKTYHLVLVHESCLSMPELLNIIDRRAPHVPMLVFSNTEKVPCTLGMHCPAILDRKTLFENPEKTIEMIESHLNSQKSEVMH